MSIYHSKPKRSFLCLPVCPAGLSHVKAEFCGCCAPHGAAPLPQPLRTTAVAITIRNNNQPPPAAINFCSLSPNLFASFVNLLGSLRCLVSSLKPCGFLLTRLERYLKSDARRLISRREEAITAGSSRIRGNSLRVNLSRRAAENKLLGDLQFVIKRSSRNSSPMRSASS